MWTLQHTGNILSKTLEKSQSKSGWNWGSPEWSVSAHWKGHASHQKTVLPNQTWVHSPAHSKANLLTPGFGEGKCSVYCRVPSKESRATRAQNTQTYLMSFSKAFLKARWGRWRGRRVTGYVISSCTSLWLVDGEVTGRCHRG